MSVVSADGCMMVEAVLVETAPRLAVELQSDFCLINDLTDDGLRLLYGSSAKQNPGIL